MQIKQIDGNFIELPQTPEWQEHIANPYNYMEALAGQFNDDFYKEIVTGKDLVVIDAGSNVGTFSLHIAPFAKKIYSIEPLPQHITLQEYLLPHPFLTIIKAALHEYTGKTKFHPCEINRTMSSLDERWNGSIEVECITIPDLFKKYNIEHVDLFKVDIEAGEWRAIKPEFLQPVFDKVDKYWLESHPPTIESQEHFAQVFISVGYKVKKFHNDCLLAYK